MPLTNEEKEQRFCFPTNPEPWFGRRLSAAWLDGALVSAVPMWRGGYSLLLTVSDRAGSRRCTYPCRGFPQEVTAVVSGLQSVALLWNEYDAGLWRLRRVELNVHTGEATTDEEITQSQALLLPPAAAKTCEGMVAAWSARVEGDIRICLGWMCGGRWTLSGPISPEGADAQRPALAVADDAVFLAWDQYRAGIFETVLARVRPGGRAERLYSLSSSDERWLCPAVNAVSRSEVYLAAVGLRTVADDLGIVDRHPFAAAGIWNGTSFASCVDKTGADPACAVDFSDGLLPDQSYKGYLGWRRRPQWYRTDISTMILCWEARPEASATAISGQLRGRWVKPDGTPGPVRCFHEGGYGFTVPPHGPDETPPAACFDFDAPADRIVGAVFASSPPDEKLSAITVTPLDKPPRWNRVYRAEPEPERFTVDLPDGEYSLYWADTHGHGNFSPDAEGEPDELIRFARDVAGLDALCLVDNDYYPHKALLDAEWQVYQEYSRQYTQPGEFVLFPGYEFTFHDAALTPHFNHRCVVYQEAGGRLVRRIDPNIRSESDLYAALSGAPVQCYPHHCTYRLSDPDKEWGVEVCSSWRVCLEETDFSLRCLRAGHRFGFIGSSDTHRCVPGLGGALTGLLARELTPAALFDAYRNRRTLATQGAKVAIDFQVNGYPMGSLCRVKKAPNLAIRVAAPKPVEFVEILRDGNVISRENGHSKTMELTVVDHGLSAGRCFYFVRVKLEGETSFNTDPRLNQPWPFTSNSRYPHNLAQARGCLAWTSPLWVEVDS